MPRKKGLGEGREVVFTKEGRERERERHRERKTDRERPRTTQGKVPHTTQGTSASRDFIIL